MCSFDYFPIKVQLIAEKLNISSFRNTQMETVASGKCLFIIVSKNSPKGDKAGFRKQNVSFIDDCYWKQSLPAEQWV